MSNKFVAPFCMLHRGKTLILVLSLFFGWWHFNNKWTKGRSLVLSLAKLFSCYLKLNRVLGAKKFSRQIHLFQQMLFLLTINKSFKVCSPSKYQWYLRGFGRLLSCGWLILLLTSLWDSLRSPLRDLVPPDCHPTFSFCF